MSTPKVSEVSLLKHIVPQSMLAFYALLAFRIVQKKIFMFLVAVPS